MSIFFDFDVGPSSRRFRRAVSGDICDIELFTDREHTDKLFGEVDIGSLIELSTLSICMINENKEVTGFMSLCDHPNVPGVDPDDWEVWIRNMYQKYFMSRTTLFIKFMCCKDSVQDVFLEEAFRSVFRNDLYLTRIVLLVNSGCDYEHLARYQSFKKWSMYRFSPRRSDDSEVNPHYMHVALRQDYCPKLRIRRAVPEDNDDIVKILDKRCPRLKDMYGKYYICELLVDHHESKRKIIVAECQERAVGVMCLNSDINYRNLQQMYDLRPYHGLMKATSLEKEQLRRSNNLLSTFGDPIMLGKLSPFDQPSDFDDIKIVDHPDKSNSKENLRRSSDVGKKQSKVYFKPRPVGTSQVNDLFHGSEDYSEKIYLNSPSVTSIMSTQSVAHLLEEEPFDYEIINIDKSLMSISEAFSCELIFKSHDSSVQSLQREPRQCRRKRKKSIATMDRTLSDGPFYEGEPNAFMIELFGLHDDVDDRNSIDLLEAAFEVMKNYEYCIISVPSADKTFSLLQHFAFVPTKPKISGQYSLYIAHRCSVIGKLRVRSAELIDIPQIATFLQHIEGRETLYTIEHSILDKDNYHTYIFMTGITVIGIGILESPEELNFIRAKFNLDAHHNHKYHLVGEGAKTGFSSIKAILVYPVFEVHFRFFAREMMRLSGATSLLWMTGYRNKLVAHKANGLAQAMIPLLPRKTELDFSRIPELVKFSAMAKNMMPFSSWLLDKKLTSVPMVNVTTRIVILGASRTALSFLNALLFGPTSTYLIFTNITLISNYGLPYMRQTNAVVEMMFPKHHNTSEKYLKSVPYTYYVNTVTGTLAEINKQDKYITLSSGSKFHYDLLFLLFGKQYQPPDYLKPLEQFINTCTSKKPYVSLSIPNFNVEPDVINYDVPENVFIINHVAEANTALKYVKCLLTDGFDFQVIVYGATIHAYCCLTALLEMNVPAESIIFVDPFPPEDPNKTRVPVFYNANVDQTVNEILKNLKVRVYRSYYFQSWTTFDNCISSVEFMSHFQVLNLECSAFFYYGKRGVNTQAYLAVNKCGMSYDGGILIDHQFRTKDPSIYAAGPVTSYYRRYYSPNKKQKYYDSYEVGEKLGAQIRNQLDPLFVDKSQKNVCVRFSLQDEICQPETNDFICKTGDETSSISGSSILSICDKPIQKVPNFVKPKVIYCRLPGGLQYLEVRSPGKKLPHYYVQSLHYNGAVLETFKTGYFKLHMTNDLVVDGITCLTFEKYSLEQFQNLYGLPSVVLNNVHLKYTTKKLDDFFHFFRAPWAHFLYHDQTDELFAMVKELLPKGQTTGDTLKEALRATGTLLTTASLASKKTKMRKKLEATPYIAAVTTYVMEWISEHDVLLPMYLQPTDVMEYVYDTKRHPAFKKRNSLTSLIMKGYTQYSLHLNMPEGPKGCGTKPLVLNDLLIQNLNTWGNVQYNIPLRLSSNETRTGTSIAHRNIPEIPHSLDCKIRDPLPGRVSGRDMVVEKETYRTTTGEYCVKPNPNKAMERADCSINCKRVIFMTGVEKRLQGKLITQPVVMSEMKDKFRGLSKSPLAPPDITVKPPDPEYIYDVVASGRNEAPAISDTDGGFRRLMDPYLSTYRANHKPFSVEEQYGIGAKDHITFYSEFNTPKVRGFGPRHKEIWMPLTAKVHRAVYDRIHVKKERHEVAACHNPVNNIKGVFVSETKSKYKIPFASSPLASWSHDESFNLPPFPPNPYQTNIAPFMYCSDYCHIAQGTPPSTVVDQITHKMKPHPHCVKGYIVSRDHEQI